MKSSGLKTNSVQNVSSYNESTSKSLKFINSRLLFNNARVVFIQHGAECYTLRLTRNNKILLTK